MKTKGDVLFFLGLAVPAIVVFRSFFSAGPLVWGDAPFYYLKAFEDLSLEPSIWESRGRLGVVTDLYWIYPLMVLYGILGKLGLSNDIIIRLIFYFPAVSFALFSSWLFAGQLRFSRIVRFFCSLFYTFNTYFILLIDGGQVGVALAYGLFPLALLHLHKLISSKNRLQFFITIFVLLLLGTADARFAIISIFTFIVWAGLEHFTSLKKIRSQNLAKFMLLGITLLLLSLYWIIPVLVIEPTTGSIARSTSQLISILHPLFLFQPHWPLNEFGKIAPPQWFFLGIPFLIFTNLFFKSRQTLVFVPCFLFFVFFAKGSTGVLGNLYTLGIETIPLASAFSDTTKFFAPLLLFAGVLIGASVQNLHRLFKKKVISALMIVSIFIYLLFLVYPAVLGNMNGVLAERSLPKDFKVLANKIYSEEGFLRTVWFPERHPFSFDTKTNPALDAKSLAETRGLGALNVGTLDRFNFMHNSLFLDWFDLLGIKYMIFSGDPRKISFSQKEREERQNLIGLAEKTRGLVRVDLGTTFPIYRLEQAKPRVFAVEKLLAVVGGDDIYEQFREKDGSFSVGNQAFVFFEDGKWNPRNLQDVTPNSTALIFNKKNKGDLVLSFLQGYFKGPSDNIKSDWAIRNPKEYLRWKYELLVNKIETKEFDYGRGIAFSSQPKEKIMFDLRTSQDDEYILAIRSMSAPYSSSLYGFFQDKKLEINSPSSDRFGWYTKELRLSAGRYSLVLENTNGFQVINVVALIPKGEWEAANVLTDKLVQKFQVLESGYVPKEKWVTIPYRQKNATKYTVNLQSQYNWLIFTDSYHPQWTLTQDGKYSDPLPAYSMVNVFYTNGLSTTELVFRGREKVFSAFIISGFGFLVLVVLFAIFLFREHRGDQ